VPLAILGWVLEVFSFFRDLCFKNLWILIFSFSIWALGGEKAESTKVLFLVFTLGIQAYQKNEMSTFILCFLLATSSRGQIYNVEDP